MILPVTAVYQLMLSANWCVVTMGAIKYYCGTVPVPYRLERDLRGTMPSFSGRVDPARPCLVLIKNGEIRLLESKKKIDPGVRLLTKTRHQKFSQKSGVS